MAEASPVAEEIPEPIPKRSDIAKGIRTVYLNRVAHMGMMLEKVNRQNRRVERIEKFAATGDAKDLNAPDSEKDEDMGVAIGNEYHYHVQAPPVAAPAVSTTTPGTTTTTQPTKSPLPSFIAPLLLAAALGTGAGGMALYNWFTSKPATTITQPSGQFDYRYGIEQRPTPTN